jgi:hypothetical protein
VVDSRLIASIISFIVPRRKYLWRTRRGNKGQVQSINPMSKRAMRTTTGVGRWMTIPTSSKGIFRHFRLKLTNAAGRRPRAVGARISCHSGDRGKELLPGQLIELVQTLAANARNTL